MATKENDPSAEGLAAMALSNSLLGFLLKSGVLPLDEAVSAIDRAQLHLEQTFPRHPGQKKAVAILEGILKPLVKRQRAKR